VDERTAERCYRLWGVAMTPNYTEEKFTVQNTQNRQVEVVTTVIPDATTGELFQCIRIQEIRKNGN